MYALVVASGLSPRHSQDSIPPYQFVCCVRGMGQSIELVKFVVSVGSCPVFCEDVHEYGLPSVVWFNVS